MLTQSLLTHKVKVYHVTSMTLFGADIKGCTIVKVPASTAAQQEFSRIMETPVQNSGPGPGADGWRWTET